MNEIQVDSYFPKRYSILVAIMLGSIMGPIDGSIVNVILPTISETFKVDIATIQWVPMIYLLTISSMLLFYGRLGDIIGYKKIYLSGLAGFVIVSGLCGFAPTIAWLIACRALQGLAAGMMMAVSLAIITATFPPIERGKTLGLNAISISAGLALGPSLGGFITSTLGWRYVFFINIPIGIAALFWGLQVIPEFKGRPGNVDILGALTAFISLFSILIFVNRFQYHGLSYSAVVLLLVSIISGFVFYQLENKIAQPMLNLNLFRNLTFSLANVSALLNFMAQNVMVFLTPFYLQKVLHYPSNTVGLIMTAFPLVVILIAPFSGALSDYIGTTFLACLGTGICALSLFLMSQLTVSVPSVDIVWRLALFGLGTGIFQSPNNSAVMGSVPRHHLGVASGILATMRNIGMVLGIAIGGAVLYSVVPPRLLQSSTLYNGDALDFLTGLKYAYFVGGILAALAIVTTLIRSNGKNNQDIEYASD